jgi:type IV pilus assembly protein PilC
MAIFVYRAQLKNGTVREGKIKAKDRANVRANLLRMKMQPLSIKPFTAEDDVDMEETPIFGSWIYRDRNGNIQIRFMKQSPSSKEVAVFTKQMAVMMKSGVPMIQALGILARQQSNSVFQYALLKVQKIVENGAKLSEAYASFPDIFDSLYIALVAAGEVSGKLDTILLKLVSYIERSNKVKGQVKSAMIYPVMVVVVAIAVVISLLIFVVPTFAQQYTETGRTLPLLTQWVIAVSDGLVANWPKLAGGLLLAGFALRRVLSLPRGRLWFDRWILWVPGVGLLLRKIAVGRFCSTMASMLTSGVNLLQALTICASSAGNLVIEQFVLGVRAGVEKGQKFSEPLSQGHIFPEMVISMVAVGETTGALDEMLEKVSDFYEEEVDLAVQAMLSMIEPIMIVSIGGIVAFILLAMYLPIFDMAGGVQS